MSLKTGKSSISKINTWKCSYHSNPKPYPIILFPEYNFGSFIFQNLIQLQPQIQAEILVLLWEYYMILISFGIDFESTGKKKKREFKSQTNTAKCTIIHFPMLKEL